MKALRIVLTQSSANYKKEETIDNKMTYPLPPISTIIGAIHNACNYREYKKMDISIQGKFESMHKEPYTDYCFLNSLSDDGRGILVKMKNESLLSNAFDKVASGKIKREYKFEKKINILIHDGNLLNEFIYLKENIKVKNNELSVLKDEIKKIKNILKELMKEKKTLEKNSDKMHSCSVKIEEVKKKIDTLEKEKTNLIYCIETEYNKPLTKFKTLVTSLKYYEILNNIELIIHVKSDEDTLIDIEENIYNLKSIGRSEDFVDVKEAKIVTLKEYDECDIKSNYSAYLSYKDVKSENIYFYNIEEGRTTSGTKYYLNKNYTIENGKRVFKKKKVIYASQYGIEETSDNVFIDNEDNKEYIVNFI